RSAPASLSAVRLVRAFASLASRSRSRESERATSIRQGIPLPPATAGGVPEPTRPLRATLRMATSSAPGSGAHPSWDSVARDAPERPKAFAAHETPAPAVPHSARADPRSEPPFARQAGRAARASLHPCADPRSPTRHVRGAPPEMALLAAMRDATPAQIATSPPD